MTGETITVEEFADEENMSEMAARRELKRLTEKGIMKEVEEDEYERDPLGSLGVIVRHYLPGF